MRRLWRWCWRLDTVTGLVTLVAMELLARKSPAGWALGLAGQSLWFLLIYRRALWGLLPLTVALTVLYAAALYRWTHGAP